MTLHQLRAFAKVAEVQSFTGAAKALHLTQPAVSALVIDLVNELGCKLFERRGIKILLTQEGTALLQRAQEALAIIDHTKEEIDEIRGLKKGKIRVGGSVLPAVSFLTVATQVFKKEHSGIEIILKIERRDSLEKMMLEGQLDIAITRLPAHSPRLVSEPFREERVLVIAPPKHPLTRKRAVPLKLLAKETFVSYEKGVGLRDILEKRFAAKRLLFVPAIQVDFWLGGRDAVRSTVASGLAIGFLARCHVLSDVKAGRIKVLNVPELSDLSLTMHLTAPKNQDRSPLVQEFIRFLKDNYKES